MAEKEDEWREPKVPQAEDPFVRNSGPGRQAGESVSHFHRRKGIRLWSAGTYVWFARGLPGRPHRKVQFLDADPGVMVILWENEGKTEVVDANDIYATEDEAKERRHRA